MRKTNRILSVILTVAMLLGMGAAVIPASAEETVGSYPSLEVQYTANASAEEYYIEDAADFIYFWHNRANFKTTVKMVADVDVNPGWVSEIVDGAIDVTLATTKFDMSAKVTYSGTFDGQGHVLSGVYVFNTSSSESAAIFGRLSNATIKNLVITNSAVYSTYTKAGGLGTLVSGENTFDSIYANIDVLGAGQCGGIVGINTNDETCITRLTNVVYVGDIVSTGSIVGGLVGYAWDKSDTYLTNCGFFGTISVPSSAVAGKLVGRTAVGTTDNSAKGNKHSEIHITNCIAEGLANYDETINGAFVGQTNYDDKCANYPSVNHYVTLTATNSVYTGNYTGAFGTVSASDAVKALDTYKYTETSTNVAKVAVENINGYGAVLKRTNSYDLSSTWTKMRAIPLPTSLAAFDYFDQGVLTLAEQYANDPGATDFYIYDADDFLYFWANRYKFKATVNLAADIDLNPGWIADIKFDGTNYSIDTTGVTNKIEYTSTNSGSAWVYSGTFDGHGHVLSGVYVENTTTEESASLFGRISGTTIQNFVIKNSAVYSTKGRAGGLGSTLLDTNTFNNIYADIDVLGAGQCGGIVGLNANKTNVYTYMNQVVYAGKIVSTGDVVGGLLGYAWDHSHSYFTNCGFFGTITAPEDAIAIGKIVGRTSTGTTDASAARNASSLIKIYNCVAAGFTSADPSKSGALIGSNLFGKHLTAENSTGKYQTLNMFFQNTVYTGNYDNIVGVPEDVNGVSNGNNDFNYTGKELKHIYGKNENVTRDSLQNVEQSSLVGPDAVLANGNVFDIKATWSTTMGLVMPSTLLDFGEESFPNIGTSFVGYQLRADSNGEFSIRFIGKGDDTDYDSVGIKVVVESDEYQTISTSATTNNVYGAIIGANKTYTATELGGTYVYTLNAGPLKADVGTLKMTITTFHYQDGVEVVDSVVERKLDTNTCYSTSDGVILNDYKIVYDANDATSVRLASVLRIKLSMRGAPLETVTDTTVEKPIFVGRAVDLASKYGIEFENLSYSSYQIKKSGDAIYIALGGTEDSFAMSDISSSLSKDSIAAIANSAGQSFVSALVSTVNGIAVENHIFDTWGDAANVTEKVPTLEPSSAYTTVAEVNDVGDGWYQAVYRANNMNAYKSQLSDAGFVGFSENNINGNLFATYRKNGTQVNLSWFAKNGLFYISYGSTYDPPVIDESTATYEKKVDPTVSMLQLTATGLSMVAQTVDGGFIIIDGGRPSEYNRDYLWNYIKDRLPEGETKPRITWIFTHAHHDHMGCAVAGKSEAGFLEHYKGQIDLELVVYSAPSFTTGNFAENSSAKYVKALNRILKTHYPDTPVWRPHTGEILYLPGCEIEILFTYEDHATISDVTDLNDTSLVFRINMGKNINANGAPYTCMVFGDAQACSTDQMVYHYGEILKSNIMQVPHHGAGVASQALYELVDPDICFWSVGEYKFGYDGRMLGTESGFEYNAWLRANSGDDGQRLRNHYHMSNSATVNLNSETGDLLYSCSVIRNNDMAKLLEEFDKGESSGS